MERSSEIFLAKWTEIRKKGRLHYAIKQGVIMAILVIIVRNLFKLREQTVNEIIAELSIYHFIIVILGAIIGYGTIMWWIYENQYKAKTKK
ncbi:MAG: hypothetical protein V3U80_08580 [Flavobacteriaceae bacterium]